MSLKSELQKLSITEIKDVNRCLSERLDNVTQEELEAETLSAITNYPALNELACLAIEQGLADGLDIERAGDRGTGASHAILVLTTIADIADLPPVELP